MNHTAIDHNGQALLPAIPTHPGVVLGEELDARDIKPSAFALELSMYPNQITELIKGKRSISAALAIKLEQTLGISADFWMRMQAHYELNTERLKSSLAFSTQKQPG